MKKNRVVYVVLLSCVMLMLLNRVVFCAEYIVSPSGSDATGAGTYNSPYRTIQYVLDNVATEGDTITLRKGTFNEEVRVRTPSITIRSMDGEMATIYCAPTIDGDNPYIPVSFDVGSKGSTLDRVEVSGGFYGIFLFSEWDWDETPLDNDTATHITIRNCIIHDTGRDAIKLPAGCDDVTIIGCEIYNSGIGYPPNTDEDDKNAEGIDAVNSDRLVVQDCYIHDTATTGIYVKGGSLDSVIERCIIENCGGLGIGVGFDTSPEYFDTDINPEYYENIRGIVRNCLIRNTQQGGIALYGSRDAQIYNNTIINTAQTYHSPIYFGLTYQDWDESAGRPSNVNPVIMNNIVYQESGIAAPCVLIRYSEDMGGMSALEGSPTMDNNVYYVSGGACHFEDGRPDHTLEAATLDQWRSHINGEMHSMASDPLLDSGYRLTQASPCINMGTDSASISAGIPDVDLDGETRIVDGAVDIGAYEYTAGDSGSTQGLVILTGDAPDVTIQANNTAIIYCSENINRIILESGAVAYVKNARGNNTVTIPSDSNQFTVSRSGSYVTIQGTDNTCLIIPATLSSQNIIFNDRSMTLIIDAGRVLLGSQQIHLTETPISG